MLKIGNFQIPTAWIDSYNGLLCVILGPIMAAIWMKKSKSKKKERDGGATIVAQR